jgi:hypothetical protein
MHTRCILVCILVLLLLLLAPAMLVIGYMHIVQSILQLLVSIAICSAASQSTQQLPASNPNVAQTYFLLTSSDSHFAGGTPPNRPPIAKDIAINITNGDEVPGWKGRFTTNINLLQAASDPDGDTTHCKSPAGLGGN